MNLYRRKHDSRGFTLLEMLVAIAIFSLLAMSARQLFMGTIDGRDISSSQLRRLQDVEYAMLVIEQDFRQLVDRGVRVDGSVTLQSVFSDSNMLNTDDQAIALVRANWRNPAQQLPRSDLQRVYYRLKDNQLERQHYHVLDPLENSEPVTRQLLADVDGLKFRFFYDGEWGNRISDEGILPGGIAIELELADLGMVERRFLMPDEWEES